MKSATLERAILDERDERLVELYERLGVPSDALPYSSDFDVLMQNLKAAGDERTPREVLHRLFALRKGGLLPRVGSAGVQKLPVSPSDFGLAESLVLRQLGTLGSRDQLPYTIEFNQLLQRYNAEASEPLTPWQFWRLMTRIST